MKILFYLLLLCILFLTLSCEKEQTEKSDYQVVLTPEQKLAALVKTPIVFQYVLINEQSGRANSWIITKYGEIRTFSGNLNHFQSEMYTENDLNLMIKLAPDVAGTVTPEQLLKYYQLNFDVYRRGSSSQTVESSHSHTELFRSYISATHTARGENRTRNCEEGRMGHNMYYEEINEFMAVTLESTGSHYIKNIHTNTDQILEWLKSLNVPVETPN